jgi:DNA (cytosine-5)-methyltransferase 1
MKLRVLDLFSGIGGFSLGLERTGGFETVAFCEIEDYPRRVLEKHWPGVPIYDDVRTLTADTLARDGIAVDVICGGFPCQDLSFAGRRAGLEGARSGLWSEYARLIGELRPRFVLVENVPGLLSLGMGAVLGDLAALGYDATWDCIPAAAVGAPHRRDRVWLIAHAGGEQHQSRGDAQRRAGAAQFPLANAESIGRGLGRAGRVAALVQDGDAAGADASDALCDELRQQSGRVGGPGGAGAALARQHGAPQPLADAERRRGKAIGLHSQACGAAAREATSPSHADGAGWWLSEPDVGRVVARLSSWLDGGRLENADACQGGTREILRVLQRPHGAKALRWTARGFEGFHAAEILLSAVREYEGPAKPLGNVSLAREGSSQVVLRGLWFDGSLACPSCRRAAGEQRTRQYPDAMRVVSQLLACDCRSAWLDRAGSTGTVRRVDRLKSLGNAVVPQIPELIGRAILKAEGIA